MKKKLIIALGILSVLAVAIFYFLTTSNIGTDYNTAEVEIGEVEKYVEEVGTVSSKNIRNYYGNSSSKVEILEVELGDFVEEGQLLIKFEDNVDIEIQKVEKQIEALEASYNEALSGADFESINGVKIEISSIRNSIDLAKENKDRIEELYKNEAATESELEQATNNLEQLQNNLALAQNRYNQLVKGLSENMKTKYEAEIDVLLLSLESLEKNKENSIIYADFDGVITELNTFEGDVPSAGFKILEMQDPSKKSILVDFMAEDALIIKPDMKAEVNDEDLNIRIENLKVHKIHPKAFTMFSELGVEENRQTVEINLPQSNEELPIGLKLETKVMIEELREVLLIPVDAVYEKDMKKYVELLEDGEPVEREVITGIESNNYIEIKEGLQEGDKVIINYEES
ncbi:MAG: efflux RND transporter periplasmic adaptor subunit [Bacillota bacterium]|nr:efflux RND transporter periplasmic adaptor subunit [Bacillota bacterium]